jgi:predicted amidohydrolase
LFKKKKKKKVWLAIGLYRPAPGGILYNSALIINRRGELVTVYNKIHLTGGEKNGLTAGDKFCCFDTEFGKVGICICWDMQFPETCRILTLMGAKLILCPTWGWEEIYAGSRAYENGVYVAGAMAVPFAELIQGIRSPSSVIDPEGKCIAAGRNDSGGVICCELDLSRKWEIHGIRINGRRPELYRELI